MDLGQQPGHYLVLFIHKRVRVGPAVVPHTLQRSSENLGLVCSFKPVHNMRPIFLSHPLKSPIEGNNHGTDHIDALIFNPEPADVAVDNHTDLVH